MVTGGGGLQLLFLGNPNIVKCPRCHEDRFPSNLGMFRNYCYKYNNNF